MGSSIKKIVNQILPNRLKKKLSRVIYEYYQKQLQFGNISYSQEGEDLILNRVFDGRKKGFYIDVGAHHPRRFSNTYFFYKRGWRGINIDPLPGVMNKFNDLRPDDINLEFGISNSGKKLKYYMFNEPALNTFSEDVKLQKDGLRNYKHIDTIKIPTYSLKEILREYLPKEMSTIDFLTVDAEGLDLEVLESSDWNKYRPKVVLVEDLKKKHQKKASSAESIESFMDSNEYELFAKTFNTLFYVDKNK